MMTFSAISTAACPLKRCPETRNSSPISPSDRAGTTARSTYLRSTTRALVQLRWSRHIGRTQIGGPRAATLASPALAAGSRRARTPEDMRAPIIWRAERDRYPARLVCTHQVKSAIEVPEISGRGTTDATDRSAMPLGCRTDSCT